MLNHTHTVMPSKEHEVLKAYWESINQNRNHQLQSLYYVAIYHRIKWSESVKTHVIWIYEPLLKDNLLDDNNISMASSSFISSLNLKDIFPTAFSIIIFVSYMALFINQGIIVTASRMGGKTYPYNPAAVVLLTEALKFVFSTFTYIQR